MDRMDCTWEGRRGRYEPRDGYIRAPVDSAAFELSHTLSEPGDDTTANMSAGERGKKYNRKS